MKTLIATATLMLAMAGGVATAMPHHDMGHHHRMQVCRMHHHHRMCSYR